MRLNLLKQVLASRAVAARTSRCLPVATRVCALLMVLAVPASSGKLTLSARSGQLKRPSCKSVPSASSLTAQFFSFREHPKLCHHPSALNRTAPSWSYRERRAVSLAQERGRRSTPPTCCEKTHGLAALHACQAAQ